MVDTRETNVFIRTCGETTFDECHELVKAQCDGSINLVKNVIPVHESFNYCLNKAITEYFIVIDADVLLLPGALNKLLSIIKNSDENTAIVMPLLYDEFLLEPIYAGLKIYRSSIVRRFKYQNLIDDDRSFNDKCISAGYKIMHLKEILGKHGTKENEYSAFKRNIIRSIKYRIRENELKKTHGIHKHGIKLLTLYSKERDDKYLFGALGSILGLLTNNIEKEAFSKQSFENIFRVLREFIDDNL